MRHTYSYRSALGVSGAGRRLFITASILCSLLSVSALAASGERKLLGEASHIVPGSIRVGPNGSRFAVVVVNPQTKKRSVVVNCKRLPEAYDMIAKGTPIFSLDGKRIAFVASRRGKCFVVVDGKEGQHYEITSDRWPIADLVFSPTGRYLAYKTRRDGKNHLVVNEKEFGPYDDVVTDAAGKVPGIGDFRFAGDDNYFSYRAKTGDGMVACRGWIQGGKIALASSKKYETIGVGSPVWLRGKSGEKGHLFAFIARENGKEFIGLLPKPKDQPNKPKMYDSIRRSSLICSPNTILGFTARDANKKWVAVIDAKEWKPCDGIGELMVSPSGNRWACGARMKDNIVMLVNGQPGPGYSGIRHPGTVFVSGEDRVIYAAVKDGRSLVTVDGKEGGLYREVDGGSIMFGPHRRRMAYTAGDGKKQFVVLDAWKGPSFQRVWNLRFDPSGKRFAYRSQDGLKDYVVIDGKIIGPYEGVAPGSPVFSPDGRTVAWTAMGQDGNWRVYVNGQAGPAFDSIVSRLTFAPDSSGPVYVARILSDGKYSFAMVSGAGAGREYTSIWMGNGGRLFVREGGRVEYFAKQGPVVYRATDPVAGPHLFLSDIKYEKATTGHKDRPAYDRNIEGGPLTVGGTGYAKGIGTCAPSEITYKLGAIKAKLGRGGPLRFTAMVAIDDKAGDKGTVRCEVYAADKKLASSPLLRRGVIHRFDVTIPPDCRTVRLVTTDGGDGKNADWCDWIKAAIEAGQRKTYLSAAARIYLHAQWAWLKGDGISYEGGTINRWDEKAQARWDFIGPADGTYELFISYGCPKEEAGSEFAVDIGGKSFPGKAESTGARDRFGKFSVGKVSLKKGEMYAVTVRVTKKVGTAMHLRSLALLKK